MKFIHTGDLHLGMEPDKDRPWSKTRARELWDTFANIIEMCRKNRPDLLLIAGDLFHRQPLVRELKEVNAQFASIDSTKVVLIAGNHDYIGGTSEYSSFKWAENVYFITSDKPDSIYFEDIDTEIYGFSYHTRDIFEPLLKGLKPEDPSRINILLGHGGEASKLPVDFKELARAGFDYVAMGHLHKPIDIADNIRYCGSPEPLDRNETGVHGIIVGSVENSLRTETAADERAVDPGSVKTTMSNDSHGYEKITKTQRISAAARQYIRAVLDIGPDDTNLSLRGRMRELVENGGENNFYTITLRGEHDPEIVFDLDGLGEQGLITDIFDETRPLLDFDRLERENKGNVIGLYIEKLRGADGTDPETAGITEKALYYGVMALTGRSLVNENKKR